jgi:hypothetical protein
MTPQDQEKLFKRALKKFGQGPKWTSGYVHGVLDESRYLAPRCPSADMRYYAGYLSGFLDSYGEDYKSEPWGSGLAGQLHELNYRWWL